MEKNIKTASKGVRSMYEWLEEIVFALVAVILVFTFLFRVVTVTGKSMLPNFVEGEKVVVTNTGTVYIDGEALNETQFGIENGITFHPYDGYEALVFPQTVPKGCVFVLGDNRTVSRDSRYAEIGMIDTRHIMGEAVFTLYPFDRFGFVKTNENN